MVRVFNELAANQFSVLSRALRGQHFGADYRVNAEGPWAQKCNGFEILEASG